MFRAMVEAAVKMGDEVDTKVGLIREEFLQENEEKAQDEEVHSLYLLQLTLRLLMSCIYIWSAYS